MDCDGRKIQRVEFCSFFYVAIYCPFCGQKVCPSHGELADSGECAIAPCQHTLFVAHDEKLEYCAARFNENVGLPYGRDEEAIAEGVDAITDRVTLPDAVKFAATLGRRSGFRRLHRIAPIETN